MILGLGYDLVEIHRIKHTYERFGQVFTSKIFHEQEITQFLERFNGKTVNTPLFIAARFAAKEAAVKALGTGFSEGIGFKDIVILSNNAGKPSLFFKGAAQNVAKAMGVTATFLSITHEKSMAGAIVVLEGKPL